MSVLTPSPADLSVKLLDRIIGPGWQNLFTNGVQGGHLTLLGHMFATWNTLILSGLVVLFSVVATSGIISAAHEGKQTYFHGAWVPIRAVGSIGLLTPLPWAKGFCLLQALVLMFTSYGIGLADHLWAPAVQYLTQQGGTLTAPAPASVWSTSDTVLRALIEREYFVREGGVSGPALAAMGAPTSFVFVPGVHGAPAQYVMTFKSPSLSSTNFGTITVPCAGATADALCTAKEQAMLPLIGGLNQIAGALISQRVGGRNLPTPPPGQVSSLVAQYIATVQAAVPAYVQQQHSELANNLTQFSNQAQAEGWASAGMWYESIARANDLVYRAVRAAPSATAAPWSRLRDAVTSQGTLPGYLAAGEALVRAADPRIARRYDEAISRNNAQLASPKADRIDFLERKINAISSRSVNGVENALLHPDGDPLSRLSSAGNSLDNWVGTLWAGTAITKIIGVRLPTNLHIAALGFLMAGADLAVYLPALPMLLYTLALIGWLILVLESLVAAPLWAAAHGMPEGPGFAGTAARQGYMLFLSVLIRPALMIFGYILSVGVFDGVALLIGQSWQVFSAGTGYVMGPVVASATVVVMVTLITMAAHQCFGLITWLPAKVTNWIGQFGENLGEQQSVAQVRAGVGVAAGVVARAGASAHASMPKKQSSDKPQGGESPPPAK
ncbi:MAG: DotA/TraY family protein [Acidiferrobacteraceae bacterium]